MDAKMYDQLAAWWPLLSAPEDYAEEAAFYRGALVAAATRRVESILELGSGGGNNASHLKHHHRLTLVDRAPGMLEVSRALNPECEHVRGDMRSVRLGRCFDAVFVHDAVSYVTTEDDLRRVFRTAWAHVHDGGAALFAPDHVRESFRPSTVHGGHDGPDGRGLRYLEWTWDPDPHDTTVLADYALMLRHRDGSVQMEHDRHVEGLFPVDRWLACLEAVGFHAEAHSFRHSDAPTCAVVFVGRKNP